MEIVYAVAVFAGLGIFLGVALAIASRVFAVRTDERIDKITEALPGANCGGCGYSGCAQLAEAIVKGEAPANACRAGGAESAHAIGAILGIEVAVPERLHAEVMCSGGDANAVKKYLYAGAEDCAAAEKLGGGDKCCPNGCIGLGSCAAACPYHAISVEDGLAQVDAEKCRGCGVCVANCPKHIIRLVPYSSTHWVGCLSVENGKNTRAQCAVGCISCRLCEKACPTGAIRVNDFVASIQYDKCIGCGACAEKCPRHIIHFIESEQDEPDDETPETEEIGTQENPETSE